MNATPNYPPAPKKTIMRWGKRQVELLVRLFAPHPYLYDATAAQQYPDERESKFYEIFEQIRPIKHDLTIEALKVKINTLFKQYQKEIQKIERARLNGTVYSPSFWWFDKLKMYINSGHSTNIPLPYSSHHVIAPPIAVINPILVQPSRFICPVVAVDHKVLNEARPMEPPSYVPMQDNVNVNAVSDIGTIVARPMGYSMPTSHGMPSNEEIAQHLQEKESEYGGSHNTIHHTRIVNYLRGYSQYIDLTVVTTNPEYLKEYFYITPS